MLSNFLQACLSGPHIVGISCGSRVKRIISCGSRGERSSRGGRPALSVTNWKWNTVLSRPVIAGISCGSCGVRGSHGGRSTSSRVPISAFRIPVCCPTFCKPVFLGPTPLAFLVAAAVKGSFLVAEARGVSTVVDPRVLCNGLEVEQRNDLCF
jgi:hypothetical protein